MNNIGDQNCTDNGSDVLNTSNCSNSDNTFNDNNNNNITTTVNSINNNNINNNNTNNAFVHSLFKSPSSNMKLLPVIKEENVEGRKKLENHIAIMRAESNARNASALNQECNYSLGMKQERTMSPITVGSNRT